MPEGEKDHAALNTDRVTGSLLDFLFGPHCPECGWRLHGYTRHEIPHFWWQMRQLRQTRDAALREGR